MLRMLLGLVPLLALATAARALVPVSDDPAAHRYEWRAVTGTGIHYFSTAIVHSTEPTATGMIQRSTETVELAGDLVGRLLYQPVSVFDFAAGTLVNTGHQVFSGTVLGSDPVLRHDSTFRFEVDLSTGATVGRVHLSRRIAGPWTRCHLSVVGTGLTVEGDATFDYAGECRVLVADEAALAP